MVLFGLVMWSDLSYLRPELAHLPKKYLTKRSVSQSLILKRYWGMG